MLFGGDLRVPETAAAADWLQRACSGAFGTVGGLVPATFSVFLRAHPPPPNEEDWALAYRDLFIDIAEVGVRHTSTPDRANFALWEGHGALNPGLWSVAWREPPINESERFHREAHRASVKKESARQAAAIRAELAAVPLFSMPDRTYHLLEGPVSSVAALGVPQGTAWRWHQPDLFWPEDRRWFVATDVDYWSLYIGGSEDFITELASRLRHPTEVVTASYRPPEE